MGLALQQSLEPGRCFSAWLCVGVAPGHEVGACPRHCCGVERGGGRVEEGAKLVDRRSGLRPVALSRYPQGVGFVVRAWVSVVVDWYPGRDAAAGLVAPDVGLAQGGEGGDRDVHVGVARVPPEGGGGVGTRLQLQLQGREGFATGHAEALRCMLGQAVGGPEEGALAIDQENRRLVSGDQTEGVYQAPQFG